MRQRVLMSLQGETSGMSASLALQIHRNPMVSRYHAWRV
jgi:hypothetical protein